MIWCFQRTKYVVGGGWSDRGWWGLSVLFKTWALSCRLTCVFCIGRQHKWHSTVSCILLRFSRLMHNYQLTGGICTPFFIQQVCKKIKFFTVLIYKAWNHQVWSLKGSEVKEIKSSNRYDVRIAQPLYSGVKSSIYFDLIQFFMLSKEHAKVGDGDVHGRVGTRYMVQPTPPSTGWHERA